MNNYTLLEETVVGHREITEAIKRHDCRDARESMILHVMANKMRLSHPLLRLCPGCKL